MIHTSTAVKNLIVAIIILIGTDSHAGIVRAIQSGNWENATSWQHGVLPTNGDSIIIPAGKSIRVTTVADYSGGSAMKLNIYGELTFQTGKKLLLPIGSNITLQVAALIIPGGGGGNSNIINIGSVLVWNTSTGTITGYLVLPSTPLPVKLIDFTAKFIANQKILISWETATEVNNDFFNIERSADGVVFETIGRVEGHGSSSTGYEYSFMDVQPAFEKIYYRLKQVDFDSRFDYSQILLLKSKTKKDETVNLFPNPTRGDIFLTIPVHTENASVEVTIIDTKAHVVFQKLFQNNPGSGSLLISEQETMLKPGIYCMAVEVNKETFRTQLVVY